VPEDRLRRYLEDRESLPPHIARPVEPDIELVEGVSVETDLGAFRVYETPGHAPSEICLYQPQQRLLISGDHLLGRISLYFDYGWTPDPVGEFLSSLETVEQMDVRLCVSGHGRPFTDIPGHIAGNRKLIAQRLAGARNGLQAGPLTAVEVVPAIFGAPLRPETASWWLTETLCYLTHLQRLGEVVHEPDGTSERWRLV
jgi:glyoxylase-like metal-dependent hydrolase (beta-lactamase superfamily II)